MTYLRVIIEMPLHVMVRRNLEGSSRGSRGCYCSTVVVKHELGSRLREIFRAVDGWQELR